MVAARVGRWGMKSRSEVRLRCIRIVMPELRVLTAARASFGPRHRSNPLPE